MGNSAFVQDVRRRTRLLSTCTICISCCLLSLLVVNQWQENLNLRHESTFGGGGATTLLDVRMLQPPPQWSIISTTRSRPSSNFLTVYPNRKADIAGLGNLLFQFASCFGLATSSNRNFAFDKHHFGRLLAVFEVLQNSQLKSEFEIENIKILPKSAPAIYFPGHMTAVQNMTGNVSLPGFLQSWKYFHLETQSDLQKMFKFHPKIQIEAEEILRKIRAGRDSQTTLVGVHVRRGDIVSDPEQVRHGHKPAPVEYFRRAMDFFSKLFPKLVFVVLTNDLVWTETHLGGNSSDFIILKPDFPLLTTAEATGVDLCLLSLCDHLIQSVGTFGWWGAYLNELRDGRSSFKTVYYSDWPRKGSEFAELFNTKDYHLPHWIAM